MSGSIISFLVNGALSLPKAIGAYLSHCLNANIECYSKDTWAEMLRCATGPKRLEVLPYEVTLGIITLVLLLPKEFKQESLQRIKQLVKKIFDPLLENSPKPVTLEPYELTAYEKRIFGEDKAPE